MTTLDSKIFRRVLIFGGTGSLGTTLTRRLLDLGIVVGIFSRDEAKHFYHKQKFPGANICYYVGDVRNYSSVEDTIIGFQPDVIICAAAMKQVPLCEEFPEQAVQTNVLGTENICRAAMRYSREIQRCFHRPIRLLGISTDKAVKPINSYGCTKALQEQITLNSNDGWNLFANCVRYGNVLESTGSVIPVFKKLIEEDKKLTITDKHMTRFLLSLDEAVDLIFKALKEPVGGKIFVPNLRSARIQDVAAVMMDAAGYDTNSFEYTGIRPGEKLHELLISEHECHRVRWTDDCFVIEPRSCESSFQEDEFSSGSEVNLLREDELTRFLLDKGVVKHWNRRIPPPHLATVSR